MMQHTKLELTVDPDAWHVDPDGAIVIDTADMLLVFPQSGGGAERVANRIFGMCEWTDATVGHIDDTPTPAGIVSELAEIRRTLTDTVTDLRSVLDPTRPAA